MTQDNPREACGVFGIRLPAGEAAAPWIRDGLSALQHRGQEAAGLAVSDGRSIAGHKAVGLVAQVLGDEVVWSLPGNLGIGHTRYSTAGGTRWDQAQPLVEELPDGGQLALAHNGNLTMVGGRRVGTTRDGDDAPSDTQLLAELIARQRGRVEDIVSRIHKELSGAWSLVMLDTDHLYGMRDPFGFHPLCVGRLDGGGWVIASETAALDLTGAVDVREVEPGELVIAGASGLRSVRFADPDPHLCAFEQVYFARPDSRLGGRRVHETRRALGRALAEEASAEADLVLPVPTTATSAALGFAERSGIRYDEGFAVNRHVGRTFIEPTQTRRDLAVRLKLAVLPEVVRGRRVVLVDDSLVRGSTLKAIIRMVREAGVAAVHLRIASPPIRWPCHYGIDMGTRSELVAAGRTPEQIAALLGCDSLAYLSLPAFARLCCEDGGLCTACFTSRYPVPAPVPG